MKDIASEKSLEVSASEAVRGLLHRIPAAKVSQVVQAPLPGRRWQADTLVRLEHGDETWLIVLEVKAQGAPRIVRSAMYQLESYVAQMRREGGQQRDGQPVPMLVSPYLSPESRAICHEHDVAYLDLEGNAWLAFGGIYIERTVPSKPKPEVRELRSIFTPKAAAILRALLREPDRPWRVADLAASANASFGHVSNVCKALFQREWADRQTEGVVLTQPAALMRTWRESYRRPRGVVMGAYTHLHGGQFDELARGVLNVQPERPRAVYALASAAQWLAPYSRDATSSFYVDEAGAPLLQETLELKQVGMGANVALHVIADESLFDDAIEPLPGAFCTDPTVTYLDLWTGNDREREAAEHLAQEVLPWIE